MILPQAEAGESLESPISQPQTRAIPEMIPQECAAFTVATQEDAGQLQVATNQGIE